MTLRDLAGRTALVTGVTSGIGKATGLLLAARGAHVLVAGRNEQRGTAALAFPWLWIAPRPRCERHARTAQSARRRE